MEDPKHFASLSSALLARKGGAAPARPVDQASEPASVHADVVPISRKVEVASSDARLQQNRLAQTFSDRGTFADRPRAPRRESFSDGRKAAFTLRLDEQSHLRLRLACTASNRSAQHIVSEALERYLADMPELGTIAGELRRKRSN